MRNLRSASPSLERTSLAITCSERRGGEAGERGGREEAQMQPRDETYPKLITGTDISHRIRSRPTTQSAPRKTGSEFRATPALREIRSSRVSRTRRAPRRAYRKPRYLRVRRAFPLLVCSGWFTRFTVYSVGAPPSHGGQTRYCRVTVACRHRARIRSSDTSRRSESTVIPRLDGGIVVRTQLDAFLQFEIL